MLDSEELLKLFSKRVGAAIRGAPAVKDGPVESVDIVLESLYHHAYQRGRNASEDYNARSDRSEALTHAVEALGTGGSPEAYIEYAQKFYPYLHVGDGVDQIAAELNDA